MKVKVSLAALSAAWNVLSTAVPQRSPRPVLSNIRLRTVGKTLELSATDLEISVRYILDEAEIVEEGECLVNADRIGRVLRENPSEVVELETVDGITRMICQDNQFELPGDEPSNFPEIREAPADGILTLEQEVCRRLIHQTSFAAAHEETRYALNGVLLDLSGGKLVAVATDGKRLSRVKVKCKGAKSGSLKALVPLRGIQALDKILSQGEENVVLAADDGNLYAKTKNAEVVSRLLEGNFPEYEDVIPSECKNQATVNRQDLSSKLRMADAFTTEDSRAVKMAFAESGLTISANVPDSGRARVVVPIAYEGEELEIAFNPQYFLDALKVVADDEIRLEFQDSQSSAKMTAGDAFTYVIMPLALD